jgi:hypothetical protein
MNGGVVKPHLIENKNGYEYPRAGNEQTIGRQRVGIPLEPRPPDSPESAARFGSLGPTPICSDRLLSWFRSIAIVVWGQNWGEFAWGRAFIEQARS